METERCVIGRDLVRGDFIGVKVIVPDNSLMDMIMPLV